MDTFRKWLNKPKADDKSLLARFYHADRSLTAVTSELDSFDGRAEPDRCSRLVNRLRQGQDKVLAITNLIMEELLGEDRDPRAFRAKFPEEVLQENLAGQLWFGAECLAAGSSIMNREQESKEMRPLAQAVTKSLGNVRNLLRDQCLRNNVPNSKTLHLDINDSTTEQLYESLKIFDRLFAEFELRYVSAMVQVKTKQEYEMQELISVLFSETLQRALKMGLLEQDKVDAFDPALMFSIPRLAIITGLVIYPDGPLNMNMTSEELSEMFRPFRTILIKIRDLLNTLDKNDLFQLEKLLCTNEDINTRVPVGTSSIEAPSPEQQTYNNKNNSNNSSSNTNCDDENNGGVSMGRQNSNNNRSNPTACALTEAQVSANSSSNKVFKRGRFTTTRSPSISSVSANSSTPSTPTASPTPSPTPSNSLASTASSAAATSTTSAGDFTDEDDDDDDNDENDIDDEEADVEEDGDDDNTAQSEHGNVQLMTGETDIVAADCASGYLIPNTNFGNLLQPQQVPLTDNFIASEDEFVNQEMQNLTIDEDVPTTSSTLRHNRALIRPECTENLSTSLQNDKTSTASNSRSCRHRHHSHSHHHHHHHHRPNRSSHHHHHHGKLKRCHQDNSCNPTTTIDCNADCSETKTGKKSEETTPTHHDTSSVDSRTSSSLSDGDSRDASLVALRSNGRLKFKTTENLLHRLFVCIAGVADQLQTNFASDLRQILRSVFLMNMSVTQEELDIPEKTMETLFEFLASENDVIRESSAGSNQSIYSAEEVNPELDNVFNNNNTNSNNNNNNNNNSGSGSRSSISSVGSNNSTRHSNSATIQRGNTRDAATTNTGRNHVERSRSLGEQEQHENNNNNSGGSSSSSSRRLSAYITGRRLSASPQNVNATSSSAALRQQLRNRNNSVGSNSPNSSGASSSSSESSSPVSERAAAVMNNNNHNNNNLSVSPNTANVIPQPASRAQSTSTYLSPPAWVPDDKAPRCMSCNSNFTAFRRRHHCRNCGGVFCAVCSNASAPLPKYGLTKAVRVCRDCYVREFHVTIATNDNRNVQTPHQTANTATAGGS